MPSTNFGIPAPKTPIDRNIVEVEHQDYQDQRNQLRLYRETVDGTGGYAPYTNKIRIRDTWPTDESDGSIKFDTKRRTYLYRHPREGKKFWRRAVMAYHIGVVRKALRMVVGFLTKKDPLYSDYPAALTKWMTQVNRRKATWQLLKNTELVPMTLYYGELPVLLHSPPHEAETRAQQIEMGADMVAEVINPEMILDWRRNDEGGYHWLKYVENRDTTPDPRVKEHVKLRRFHYLTQEGWWYVDELPDQAALEWPVVASGEWGKDTKGKTRMPLVVWRANQTGASLTHHATQLERELYNVTSLLQEIDREMTYPQAVLPDPGEKLRLSVRATDSILWAEPEAKWVPYVLAPDVKAVEHFGTREEELKARILEEFGLEFSEGATTGIAQSFKMSKIVRLLVDLASNLEESEYQTHAMAGEILNSPLSQEARAEWPAEFDARDVEKEVTSIKDVLAEGPVIGNTATKRLRLKLVTTVDNTMDEETIKDVEKEIATEVEAENNADTRPTDPEGDEDLDDAEKLIKKVANSEDYGAR